MARYRQPVGDRFTGFIMLVLAGAMGCACASVENSKRDAESCYPYLPRASGQCRTSCSSTDHCAGSRGPADFAENGWPLDCIGGECVPLPPEAVEFE